MTWGYVVHRTIDFRPSLPGKVKRVGDWIIYYRVDGNFEGWNYHEVREGVFKLTSRRPLMINPFVEDIAKSVILTLVNKALLNPEEDLPDHLIVLGEYRGTLSGKTNELTRLILRSKNQQDPEARQQLAKMIIDRVKNLQIDLITYPNSENTKGVPHDSNHMAYIVRMVADSLGVAYGSVLRSGNEYAEPVVRSLRVLVIDDVIHTGRTMRKVVRALRRAGAKRITFLAIADATKSNPEDLQPYNPIVNPDKDLINQIQNPDLKIIAQILLAIGKDIAEMRTDIAEMKTDISEMRTDIAEMKTDIADIKGLMGSELWHRELHLISSSKVKPKGLKAVLKPDLDTSQKYADVVYIYEENGQTVARIVEAKGLISEGDEEDIREKFQNTVKHIKDLGFNVDRYELYLVIPKRLEEYITIPTIENVRVVKVNPEDENEGEGEDKEGGSPSE